MVHGIVFQDETKFGDVVNINDTNVNYENSSQSIFYVICLIFFKDEENGHPILFYS